MDTIQLEEFGGIKMDGKTQRKTVKMPKNDD